LETGYAGVSDACGGADSSLFP